MKRSLLPLLKTGAGLLATTLWLTSAWAEEDRISTLDVDAGPGSAQPHMARGADGTVVLSWLEPRGEMSVLRFSVLGPDGWSAPHEVAEGGNWFVNWADFPSVVPISGSFWAAHWLQKRPEGGYAYDVYVTISRDSGQSWSEGLIPHRDGTPTEHGFVSLFPWQDGAGVIWLDGRNMQAEGGEHGHGGGGMTLRSAVITPDGSLESESQIDGLVCDCCKTDVAVARDGPVAVYRNRTEEEIRDIYLARADRKQWAKGEAVADDGWEISGCPVNGPAIAAQGDAVAVAWFTNAEDSPRVRFARSSDGGRTFGPALDIDDDEPIGRVDVAMLPDGSAALSWLDSAGSDGEIKVQLVDPDNHPGSIYRIARSEVSRPAGFPQLAVDELSLVVAWTDASGGLTQVKSARIMLRP